MRLGAQRSVGVHPLGRHGRTRIAEIVTSPWEAPVSLVLFILACAEAPTGFSEVDGVGVLGLSPGGSMYLCGVGEKTPQSRWLIEQDDGGWMSSDGLWSLRFDQDGYELKDEEQNAWQGSLTAFSGGGLFDGVPESCRSGAVLADGQVYGTWCDGLGGFSQVEPVDPITGEPEQLLVQLVMDMDYRFTLQRLP